MGSEFSVLPGAAWGRVVVSARFSFPRSPRSIPAEDKVVVRGTWRLRVEEEGVEERKCEVGRLAGLTTAGRGVGPANSARETAKGTEEVVVVAAVVVVVEVFVAGR